jgi:thiamine-monophosphate kinase
VSLTEVQAIEILRAALSPQTSARSRSLVRIGIGDDAAVIKRGAGDQVCTVDSCEEGVHFLWEWMQAADVAQKSFHSALSDVVAMGGTPSFIVCHLTLGPRVTARWLKEFALAQAHCSKAVGAPIVGGNISFGSTTNVVTTVTGEVRPGRALLRSGAKAGDELWLLGPVGLARAGLLLLQKKGGRARGRGAEAAVLRAFRAPESQYALGQKLFGRAHACLDISDGLRRDAAQLAHASAVRVVVDAHLLEATLDESLLSIAQQLGTTALELALEGGEDYALLATGPAARRPRASRVIGRVEACKGKPAGAFLATSSQLVALSGGFVHRRRA